MTSRLPAYDMRDPAPLTLTREELVRIQGERLRAMGGA